MTTNVSDGADAGYQASLAAIDARVRQKIAQTNDDLGRPLRVLHIGNIANNAYVNAKIMRRYGIEADVLVLDYYHIMGCPEWEEGVIEKLEGTQLDPDWYLTKVGNFTRPDWFLQGPSSLCAGYLSAKADGRSWLANWRHSLIDWNLRLRGATCGPRQRLYGVAWSMARLLPRIKYWIGHAIYMASYCVRRLVHLTGSIPRRLVGIILRHSPRALILALAKLIGGDNGEAFADRWSKHRSLEISPAKGLAVATEPIPASVHVENMEIARTASLSPAASAHQNSSSSGYPPVEPIREEDRVAYGSTAERFGKAFAYYDIVQGYAVDGIYPLLAGKTKGYACYEHGTLRDIPYQPNTQGRACAHAYRNAPAVFITNTDCVASAANLGIGPERRFPIPHAFDSDKVLAFRAEHRDFCKPHNKPVTFIAPARHHWKHGEFVSWLKGNDVPIRAARLMADQGLDFKILFVRWGQEVGESEKLIAELDVGKHFEWIEPVPKHRLWQYYMSCNGVLDQFVIPAIGGVSFEALAFGRPLFTRIDEPVFKEFFGDVPPLINVYTPEGLAEAMGRVVRDPSCFDGMSAAALDWTAKYHSSQRILEILLSGYDRILNRPVAGASAPPNGRVILDAAQ